MFGDLLLALALIMVLEGLLPAINPAGWRQSMEKLATLSNRSIRLIGLTLLVSGGVLFQLVR